MSKKTTSKKKNLDKNSSDVENFNLNFDKKILLKLLPIVLIAIAMFFAYDIRSTSQNLDGFDDNIRANMMSQIEKIILSDIQANYPLIQNDAFIQEKVLSEMQKVEETGILSIGGETVIVDDLVNQQIALYKSQFQDDDGNTYLTAIDPYFFLRKAQNYDQSGSTGDEIIDGVPYETKQLAPGKKEVSDPNLHVWLESKLIDTSEGESFSEIASHVFLLPAIISAFCVIPIFIFTRLVSNNLIAFFASLILVSIGTFVSRTTAGFVDTDAYNVFFPLSIAASILGAFYIRKDFSKIGLSLLGGFFTGLFLWAWISGWFFVIFTLIAIIGYIGYLILIHFIQKVKVDIKSPLLILFTYFLSSVIFVYLLSGKNLISTLFGAVTKSFSGNIGNIATNSIWPNVYSSVAELNPASFAQVISAVGGEFISILAFLGILFLTLDFKKKDSSIRSAYYTLIGISFIWFVSIISGNFLSSLLANSEILFIIILFVPIGIACLLSLIGKNTSFKIFVSILLSIWMAGTIYMSLNGVRFILLLAPAFAISAGIGLYYLGLFISRFLSEEFNIKSPLKKQIPGMVVISIVFLIIFSPMATQAKQIGNTAMPNFDDAWYSSMYKIDSESNPNAIITSWWDFGHFFAAVGNRGVTFDGGSQTTPQAHWVGKLFLETDEDKSVDILRMLTCGGNEAFNTINEFSEDKTGGVHIVDLLYSTFGKSKDEKINLIKDYKYYNFSDEEITEIMTYLHCDEPRENLVITSGDMVSKAGVWAHWGSWDFYKKYVYDNYKKLSVEDISLNLDINQSIIQGYIDELNQIDYQSKNSNVNRENLINQWFAPYPSYSGSVSCQSQNETNILCDNGLVIDGLSGLILNDDLQGYSFNNVVIPTIEGLFIAPQSEEGGDLDILITQSNSNQFQAMIMQAPLGTSLFTKLFYLGGLGTTKFEEFDSVQTQTAGNVYVWKTNFDEEIPIINSINYTISPEELESLLDSNNTYLDN